MDEIIKRLNELAKKEKSCGLTEKEKEEQKKLRCEYIADFHRGFEKMLENTYIETPDGTKTKLERKD